MGQLRLSLRRSPWWWERLVGMVVGVYLPHAIFLYQPVQVPLRRLLRPLPYRRYYPRREGHHLSHSPFDHHRPPLESDELHPHHATLDEACIGALHHPDVALSCGVPHERGIAHSNGSLLLGIGPKNHL